MCVLCMIFSDSKCLIGVGWGGGMGWGEGGEGGGGMWDAEVVGMNG